jgi:hypothetical protein
MADIVKIAVVIPDTFTFSPILPNQTVTLLQPYLVHLDDSKKVSLTGDTSTTFNFASGAKTGYLCDGTATLSIVKDSSVDLEFSVCTSTGAAASYVLTGVTLKDLSTSAPAGTTFPVVEIDFNGTTSGTLILKDRPGSNPSQATSYELWLLVMNNQAQLGAIDPKIVNQA